MDDKMADVLTAQERIDLAERRIDRFVARFEPGYRDLLCHVALPLLLTPELVSYLRNEFLRGIPWIAEVDLLLSELCSPVGYELYAMNTDVRAHLLKQCAKTFGADRMQQVAGLLISYVRYLSDSQAISDRELESQQWAAMVYLGPLKQRKAVDEIVQRFQECITACGEQVGSALLSQSEMARLAQLTQTLKAELSNYPVLIEFASLVSDVQLRNVSLTKERVENAYEVFPGQRLQLPPSLKESLKASGRIQDAKLATKATPLVSTPSEIQTAPEAEADPVKSNFPPSLKTATFQIATISLPQQPLEVFEFQRAKIERERAGLFRRRQWVVKKSRAKARRLVEPLGDELELEMVAIPGGTFLMGSPESEPERSPAEGPQHKVTVPDFFMGRYPVTQAQWRFVASLPQVNRDLNPEPSYFKGDRLPVENVSWYDAVEFCDRLSVHTDRTYRLPTEAEWEYACRAGTNEPFYFGDMILTDVSNYNGDYTYANGPKGKDRGKTTPVDEFAIANAFGLCDMHGNVWEWCQDHWHENYEGAPTDGSAWLTDETETRRVVRGGSWSGYPRSCRSAQRSTSSPVFVFNFVGFRVSCSAPRT